MSPYGSNNQSVYQWVVLRTNAAGNQIHSLSNRISSDLRAVSFKTENCFTINCICYALVTFISSSD